jgi:fatty-acyl-CoA synthase
MRMFYARARKLASALAKHGIKRGDTVSVMLANTPAMLEAHYGVPMTQGVLNTLNTRLDAAIIAFSLDHAETKVLITDREFSKTVKEALALAKVKPLVIDYDDPGIFRGDGDRLGEIEYEEFVAGATPITHGTWPDDEWDANRAQYTQAAHPQNRDPKGRRLSSSARNCWRSATSSPAGMGKATGVSSGRCRCSTATAVLPVVDLGGGRHAPCGLRESVRRPRCTTQSPNLQGDAPVRRADRDGDACCNAPGNEK